MRRQAQLLHVVALSVIMSLVPVVARAAAGTFFDDFSYADLNALRQGGWLVRTAPGHPGISGAQWGEAQLSLVEDAESAGNRLLRLQASTDGTGAGTRQAQLCHQRKYLEGSYAARVRFKDQPVAGAPGDPVIQTFYAVAPLRHDFDPQFSEMDWEYLPQGGWGSEKPRLYGISWQTVRLDPWQAHNSSHEEHGSFEGWHVLMMQVGGGRVRMFVDGRQVAEHGGRNVPVSPMALAFNLWFSPTGLLPASQAPRVYQQEVDWIFHARDVILSPAELLTRVQDYRRRGIAREDTVPAPAGLESRCDI